MTQSELRDKWAAEWEAANNLFEEGKEDEAARKLANCASMCPEAWCGLGMEYLKDNDLAAAIKRFEEALQVAKRPSTRAVCWNNIGTVLANAGYRERAIGCFLKSIADCPTYPDSFANMGLSYKWLGQTEAAREWIDKALNIAPLHQAAAFTRSLCLLLGGQWKEGWQEYESRWRMAGTGLRKVGVPWPEWDGTNGQRVLLYGEQGAGDCIMCFRYAKLMKERGLSVSLAVPPYLVSLAQHTGFFEKVWVFGDSVQGFDCHLPLMSLPRIFGTEVNSVPLPDGYIDDPPLSEQVAYGPGLNVGIFWSGSTEFKHNIWRSTHLTQWAEVLSIEGITVHSLQVGQGEAEAALFPTLKVWPTPADYLETARRIAGLDLVISIDTSVAHLAGAMGVPVWMLTPYAPDFRWLLKREDTPWYSSMRLFRQEKEFDWKPVMERIADELRRMARDG